MCQCHFCVPTHCTKNWLNSRAVRSSGLTPILCNLCISLHIFLGSHLQFVGEVVLMAFLAVVVASFLIFLYLIHNSLHLLFLHMQGLCSEKYPLPDWWRNCRPMYRFYVTIKKSTRPVLIEPAWHFTAMTLTF